LVKLGFCFHIFYGLPCFFSKAMQSFPVDSYTTTEGIFADLKPKKLQAFGVFGSHVIEKFLQLKQFILFMLSSPKNYTIYICPPLSCVSMVEPMHVPKNKKAPRICIL